MRFSFNHRNSFVQFVEVYLVMSFTVIALIPPSTEKLSTPVAVAYKEASSIGYSSLCVSFGGDDDVGIGMHVDDALK